MDAVESKHPVELPVLEERVRRDAGRSSLAIACLAGLVLLAAVYAVSWGLNIAPTGRKGMIGVKPVPPPTGNAGKAGNAVDLGDSPHPEDNQPPEAPGDAIAADPAKELLDAIADLQLADAKAGKPGGKLGGPIGLDKIGDGPDRGDKQAVQRWLVQWGDDTEVGYRRKLDFFGIYLGAVRAGKLIGAARGFETRPRETTDRPPATWFVHQEKRRVDVDRNLLKAAGVPVEATDIVAQFYPPELRAKLTAVEAEHSNKNAKDIRKTVFGIRPAGAGYELYVIEQQVD